MNAAVFDGTLHLERIPRPSRKDNEVLIRVLMAGICNTDIEITRGYIPGFKGVPGHEFIGIAEDTDNAALAGRRCTAQINCSCGTCEFCKKGLARHCVNRTVLGIVNRDGACAEYVCVPETNVICIPDEIPDAKAIFIEPLAAALELLEQIPIAKHHSVVLFGDGKLGLLCAFVLASTGCNLTVIGKHPEKLALLKECNAQTALLQDFIDGSYDVVVEATGNASTFDRALCNVKPRGILALKSTYAGGFTFNPSPIVVNEITLIGSRCGKFSAAIDFIRQHDPPLEHCITARMPLSQSIAAFEKAKEKGVLKIILIP